MNTLLFGGLCFKLFIISKKIHVLDRKCSNSRLAKSEKWEFTLVNDHFLDKYNVEAGLFLQALFIKIDSTLMGLDLSFIL
jgi:hypothetical protein